MKKQVTAAGGVLFREVDDISSPEVVLIFRRGVWDLPKGKQEWGESVKNCAVREVAEEVGLDTYPKIIQQLTDTYHEYVQQGIEYGKTTHWYAMKNKEKAEQRLHPQAEEGIEQARWVNLDEAINRVGYQNLNDVLTSFSEWYFRWKN